MYRYLTLLLGLFIGSIAVAQPDIELGIGILGSGTQVEPIPVAYRNDFKGPITRLGYYVEGSALLISNEKWKPRAIFRLQSEGSNPSEDWPEIRILNTGGGVILGYRCTPVITILAGGVVLYKISAEVDPIDIDDAFINFPGPWSGRINLGLRGNFGRWSSEMILEKSLTNESGEVVLTRESSPSFVPIYSYLNVRLGLKYKLFHES